MSTSTEELQNYLATNESIVDVGTGRLVDGTTGTEGTIGVTDRRMLFVAGEMGFTDVRYDQICSIQSWARERLTPRGLAVRLLVGSGILVAVMALIGQVVLTPTAFGSLLAVSAVGGFIVAEAVRRTGVDIDWAAIGDAIRDVDRPSSDDVIRQRWGTEYVYARQFVLIGAALLGMGSAVGMAVHTGSLLAFALTFVALGGLAVTDIAIRRMRRLDRLGESRRTERTVTVRLVGSQDVTLRLGATERIDRVLSQLSTTDAPDLRRDSDPDRDPGPLDPGLSQV